MTKAQRHPWRQPSELDDLFLYHLARLMSSAGTMVVRLCEGGFGITRREWRMIGLLATKGAMQPSQLAELAQLDRTRTSRTISTLIAKGLLHKQGMAGDVSDAELEVLSQVFERVRNRAALMQEQGSFPKAERRRGRAAGRQPARDDDAAG